MDDRERRAIARHYDQPQALTGDAAPIHVGWWDTLPPHADLAAAERAYEDRLLAPVALGTDTRVLDAGCGFGALARRLAQEHGATVHGIDLVEDHIRQGQLAVEADGLSDRIHLTAGDITALPYPDAHVDHAVVLEVLLHLPDKRPALHELARVVRPGGRVVVSDYVLQGAGWLDRQLAASAVGTDHLLTAEALCTQAEAAGLRVLDHEDVTSHTVLPFYDWSANEDHRSLRELVARTVHPWLALTTPLAVSLFRGSVRRGGWGLHFFTFERV